MKCCFVAPRYIADDQILTHDYPVGMCYVAANLKAAGHDVWGLDLNFESMSLAKVKDADVILTGGLCTHFPKVKNIVDTCRRLNPRAKIVIGGGLVSGCPEITMKGIDADYFVTGEGEVSTPLLLSQLEAGEAPDRLVHSKTIQDLEASPPPLYELFDIENYLTNQWTNSHYYMCIHDRPRSLTMIASRGCPYDCSFCYHPLGRGYRPRDIDRWLAETEDLVAKYNLNTLCVVDEVLGLDRKRLTAMCDGFKRIGVAWMCQLRADLVDDDVAKELKASGCFFVSLGVESGSNAMLKDMGKYTSTRMIEKAIHALARAKIGIQGNILVGFPEEDDTRVSESLIFYAKMLQFGLFYGRAMPYPDSRLWRDFCERGVLEDPARWVSEGCPMERVPLNKSTKMSQSLCDFIPYFVGYMRPYRPSTTDATVTYTTEKARAGLVVSRLQCNCPHCHEAIDYPRMILDKESVFEVLCRNCFKRFVVPMSEARKING